MPVIKRETSIPANGTVDNIFTGSIYEFLPWNAAIDMGVTADATGLVATFTSGSDVIIEESPVDILANLFPVIPDNMGIQDVAAGGERLVLKIRNTTGAPIISRTLARIQPV